MNNIHTVCRWLFLAGFLFLSTLMSVLALPSIQTDRALAQAPQTAPVTDMYGNVVRDGSRRFNYLVENQNTFTRVELDEQNQVISRQNLSASPFEPPLRPPAEVVFSSATLQATAGSNPSFLNPEWAYGLYGSGIGLSRMAAYDIDNDGTLEMVMAGTSIGGFGPNDFWYVVKKTGPTSYRQDWLSNVYSSSINRITVADVNANGIGEIYVGLADGRVFVYDGLTKAETGWFTAGGSVKALVVANADGDSDPEIVISDGAKIYVYSALTFALEWASTAYGGTDLAVGNVDADAAPEIVTTTDGGHGYEIDGVSHVVEWDNAGGFGNIVELGDIDGDTMQEIIGAASWYKITAFDADLKTAKWDIPTSQDIGALLVANTNGSATPEILYGDGQWGAIHCYDAATKTQLWSVINFEHGVTDIAVGDVNKDSVLEVLWGAGATSVGSDYLYVADTATRSIEWHNVDLTGPVNAVDVGNVDNDAQTEIVMVSNKRNSGLSDGVIHIFDAATHALEWRSTDLPNITASTGVKSVKIGNVDGDPQIEIVIATAHLYDGVVQIYDGQNHTFERQTPKYTGTSFTALALGDVDGDGKNEIVAGQKRETAGAAGVHLVVFDGDTAAEEWKSTNLVTNFGQVYDIELANVDNDSNIEIIASVAGDSVVVYDGVTHQLDWSAAFPAYALDVADVDSDGQPEILIGKHNGVVEVYGGTTFALENSFKVGAALITGLLVADIDQDGNSEWVVGESAKLSVVDGATKALIWQTTDIGTYVGNYNHLSALNSDTDAGKELILGSSYALLQFDVPTATPLSPSTKTVAPLTAAPGTTLNYTIALKQSNPADLPNVQMTDPLPPLLNYVSNSLTATGGSFGYSNGVISWAGTVTASQTVTISFAATVSPTTGLLTNTAIITGGGASIARTAAVNVQAPVPADEFLYLPVVLKSHSTN